MQVFLIISALLLYTKVTAHAVENLASVGNTLELLHVIFRHGDRTPDYLYPNDPYTVDNFYPEGFGHLTNKGKRTVYNLGKSLRKVYGKFLGDVYTPQDLYCISTHYPRAKASLQLVLAGLYPPTSIQKWNDDLNWQPIPCDYLKAEDTLMVPVSACPTFEAMRILELAKSTTDPIYIKYQHLLPYLREISGDAESDLITIASTLYHILYQEDEYGLPLPSWASTVYPDPVKEIAGHIMKYYTGVGKLKILQPGFLVSQILNNTYLTINGDASVKGRKLYLYSGHDINVASIMYFLDHVEPRIIAYGSQIIIEVHKILGIRFFRFLLENYQYQTPEPLFVPNCGYFCPVDIFAKLYADVLDPVQLNELCYNDTVL